jgi:Golgi apparatus protein 1
MIAQDMCATTLKAMDDDNKVKRSALNCLQQYKEELKIEKCQTEVNRRMKRAARDIRFDEVLADACQEDRTKFCNDVQMVGLVMISFQWRRACTRDLDICSEP